jgi:NitT/TauT family transport system permease protein
MSALRLASGRAFAGVVSAEVFGDAHGLGYLIQYSGATFQVDQLFVCVVVLAAFGVLLDRFLTSINRRFDKWRYSENV